MHKATVFAKAASVVTLAVGGFVPAFSADYYWTGGGDGINWSDAANWSDAEGAPVEKAPHDVAGAAAKFRDGTKAQVCFDVPATSASLDVSANDLDLTFTSTPGVTVRCSLTAGGTAHLRDPARSTIVFDGIRNVWWGNVYLRPAVVWRVKGASGMTLSDVSLARVFPTEESTFIVEGESELNVTGKITVNQRSAVVISNATVAAANLEIPRFSETGGGCVRFEGSHPRLTVSGTVSNNNMNGGGDLEFRVPEGGYDGVPFVHEGTSPFMQSADCPERDRISVLLDSPAVQSGGTLDQVLVSTTAGLAEGRLAYLPARSCCQSISASEDGRSVVFRQRPAASSLRITGEPRPYGMSEPLTLIGLANGESRPLTAPASPSANLVCTGYRLFDIAEDGARTEVDGSPFSGTACAYVHGASRRELVWTWEKPTLYVSPEGDDGATGSDWSSALRTVAEAVSRLDCARVVVSNGTYQISSANPIVVAGGTELVGFGERPEDVVIERTGGATNVLTVASADAVVKNLTVTNGKRNLKGGIFLRDGLVTHCVITNCGWANNTGKGAGVNMTGGVLQDCLVTGNNALSSWGGFSQGGGVYLTGGLVERCRIDNNNWDGRNVSGSETEGGGVYMTGGTMRNCLITRNKALKGAYGLYAKNGTVENCTIADNLAEKASTGFGVKLEVLATFRNNIVWGNANPSGPSDIETADGSVLCANTCASVAPAHAVGTVTDNPLMNADYTLDFGPCVNVGVIRPWMEDAVDLAGAARIQGGSVDLGCYERAAVSGLQCSFKVVGGAETLDAADVRLQAVVDGDATGATYWWRAVRADGAVTNEAHSAESDSVTLYLTTGVWDVSLGVTNATDGASASVPAAVAVKASAVYVNEQGTDAYPYATAAGGAHDLAAAFALLGPGGTAYVADGRYSLSNRLMLGGEGGAHVVSLGGPSRTVLQAENCDAFTKLDLPVVYLEGRGSSLEGVTVVGGMAGEHRAGGEFLMRSTVSVVGQDAVVSNCVIRDCAQFPRSDSSALDLRAGRATDVVITRCAQEMSSNGAMQGIALKLQGGVADRVTVTNCWTSGVASNEGAGGLVAVLGGTLRNALVAKCKATNSSPVYVGDGALENCSIVDNVCTRTNSAYTISAGLVAGGASRTVNCLIAGNLMTQAGSDSNLVVRAGAEVAHSLVAGGAPVGEGNVSESPVFRSLPTGDYRLKPSSPGVDAGVLLDWSERALDLAREPRRQGSRVDMGCYETARSGFRLVVF